MFNDCSILNFINFKNKTKIFIVLMSKKKFNFISDLKICPLNYNTFYTLNYEKIFA